MVVAFQLVGVAALPLKVNLLDPCVDPKLRPVTVTEVATGPLLGETVEMFGICNTVNETPFVAVPLTVTTTLPVVAPCGTGATIVPVLQFVGVVVTPLNATVLVP